MTTNYRAWLWYQLAVEARAAAQQIKDEDIKLQVLRRAIWCWSLGPREPLYQVSRVPSNKSICDPHMAENQQPTRSYPGAHCHKLRTSSAILLWMSKRSTNAWLGRINVLLAWAASAREQSEAAKRLSDQRRGILSGATDIWRNKRQEWLSRRRPDSS
jgi:hypothetical protein